MSFPDTMSESTTYIGSYPDGYERKTGLSLGSPLKDRGSPTRAA